MHQIQIRHVGGEGARGQILLEEQRDFRQVSRTGADANAPCRLRVAALDEQQWTNQATPISIIRQSSASPHQRGLRDRIAFKNGRPSGGGGMLTGALFQQAVSSEQGSSYTLLKVRVQS